MIVMGSQIRAARALLGWTRSDLARASKLHPNAVAYWEGRSDIPTGGWRTPVACRRMHEALLSAGVDFLAMPAIGVRLVATHNYCTRTRRRARARHGVLDPLYPARSQNLSNTLRPPLNTGGFECTDPEQARQEFLSLYELPEGLPEAQSG